MSGSLSLAFHSYRHCERSEAIQEPNWKSWILIRLRRGHFLKLQHTLLDCFVAALLAMTAWRFSI